MATMTGEATVRPATVWAAPPLLERIVGELREIERRNGIERTLAIGELIFNEFFHGDTAIWRDRRRNKNNSIRRLAERPDCPFCKSSLNEAVAVYVASLELPCVRTFGHIGASHVASVLKLPVHEQQSMLDRAERERLSVRELRAQVVNARRTSGERRGRPALGAAARTISAIEGDVRRLTVSIHRLDALDVGDSVARQRLVDLVTLLKGASAHLSGLTSGPSELRRTGERDFARRADAGLKVVLST